MALHESQGFVFVACKDTNKNRNMVQISSNQVKRMLPKAVKTGHLDYFYISLDKSWAWYAGFFVLLQQNN